MATPTPSDNQATTTIRPGEDATQIRIGDQAQDHAPHPGIPEITKVDNASTERNREDQTDVTKISATLPDGREWTQNWLEKMRGEAKIPILTPTARRDDMPREGRDEARDRYLSRYFTQQEARPGIREQFMGRKKKKQTARPVIESSDPGDTLLHEQIDKPERPADPIAYQADPEAWKKAQDEPATQSAEIAGGLSMRQVRRGMLGPAIATASTTGIATLLALSSSDTAATAMMRSIKHLLA